MILEQGPRGWHQIDTPILLNAMNNQKRLTWQSLSGGYAANLSIVFIGWLGTSSSVTN
jgi:hypothetical protein